MKKRRVFFITLIIFLIPMHLSAQKASKNKNVEVVEVDGVKIKDNDNVSGDVMSLFQIQKLISGKYKYKDASGVTHTRMRKEYTKALEELYKYIDKYPDRFDNAERIIRVILKRREKYSELFDQLVAYSNEHPDDLEGCGARVKEMEDLEDNPPEEIKELMEVFKQMYLYKYYDWKFHNALKESSDFTHEKKYSDAITKVSNEFGTYEKEFYNDWEDYPEYTNEAEEILVQLNKNISEFNKLQPVLNENVSSFIKLVENSDFAQADAFYPVVEEDFNQLKTIQNNIVECAKKYEELHKKLQKINPLITDASYLPFMRRFVTGIAEYPDSGVLGAIDFMWQDKLSAVKKAVAEKTRKIVNDYKKALPEKIYEADNYDVLENNSLYIDPIVNYSELGNKVNDITESFEIWNGENYRKDTEFENSMEYVSGLAKQSEEIISLGEQLSMETQVQKGLLDIFENNKGNTSFSQDENLDNLFDSLDKMRNILGDKNNLVIENKEWSKDYLNSERSDNFVSWDDFGELYTDYVNQSYEHTDNTVVEVWNGITGTYKENADIYADNLVKYIEIADVFQNGFAESISNEDYDRIKDNPDLMLEYAQTHKPASEDDKYSAKRYPELTVTLSQYILEQSKLNEESLKSAKENFETVASTYSEKDNAEVNNIVKESGDYILDKLAVINEQEKQTTEKYNSAKSKYDEVQRAYANIDRLLDEAESAFKNDLQLAKKINEQAWQEEINTWEIMDNPRRAERIEKQYSALIDRINEALNDEIVWKTNKLADDARDAMDIGHYDEALDYIDQAISLWAETHYSEKNVRFEELRELIYTAVKLQNGRELIPSDPLYAEMSQLLSQANIYYDNGERLFKENKVDEANAELAKATENLEKVRKIYPLNKNVMYLKLKIKKLQLSAKDFEKYIATYKEDAKKKVKNESTRSEGFNELDALLEIDSDNKTFAKEVDNLKISYGLKEKPVDNSAKNKAEKLRKEALALYNKGAYREASAKINEAYRYDPRNAEIRQLARRIDIKLGPVKTSSSSSSSTSTAGKQPSKNNTTTTTTSSGSNNKKAAQLYSSARNYSNNKDYQKAYTIIMSIKNNYPDYWNRSDVQKLYSLIMRNLK